MAFVHPVIHFSVGPPEFAEGPLGLAELPRRICLIDVCTPVRPPLRGCAGMLRVLRWWIPIPHVFERVPSFAVAWDHRYAPPQGAEETLVAW